ncbi:hypothetical protein HAX54_047152 [Datura stramonium]|uniref:Uncharacterized protein n=1 Tax=Datura stramonium TaxID=4076 RepID=A0ABS8SSL6_DATST|nr:hypothetical protein [Datura stramonium]
MALYTMKVASSSFILTLSFPTLTSIRSPPVAKNGYPNMINTFLSASDYKVSRDYKLFNSNQHILNDALGSDMRPITKSLHHLNFTNLYREGEISWVFKLLQKLA